MKSHYIILLVCILFGLQSPIAAQSSDWVYSPYAQYLTNDTTMPPPVGEPADAALSCFRHDTIYVLVMPTGQLYIWLRPDPLLDKYLNLSPYTYCNGNPLKYVDPDGKSPKDKVVGWIVGAATNIVPLASLSNLRNTYAPDDATDYNQALQHADNAALITGLFLTTSGASDVAAGLVVSESSLAVAATGIGAPEGGAGVVVGSTLIAKGLLKSAIGTAVTANATNNKSNGYNYGNTNTKPKSINQLKQDVNKGKAPNGIKRFDEGRIKGEQDHVHFSDGTA